MSLHWFRLCYCANHSTSRYLNQRPPGLQTHICVSRFLGIVECACNHEFSSFNGDQVALCDELSFIFYVIRFCVEMATSLCNSVMSKTRVFTDKKGWNKKQSHPLQWRHNERDGVIKSKHFPRYWPLCAGNSSVTGEFPSQRPATRSFGVFVDMCLNKRSSEQLWGCWFEMPLGSLWRHCNEGNVWYGVWILISLSKYCFLGWANMVKICIMTDSQNLVT